MLKNIYLQKCNRQNQKKWEINKPNYYSAINTINTILYFVNVHKTGKENIEFCKS